MHSKKTGAIILILFACLIVGATIFFILAWGETQRINDEIKNFRLLDCDFMAWQIEQDKANMELKQWKRQALQDKQIAGNC